MTKFVINYILLVNFDEVVCDFMRKLAFVLMAFCCFMLVGCDNAKSKDNSVIALTVCDEFKESIVYVGEDVNFDNYTLTVEFSSGETDTISLSEATITGLDTNVVGKQLIQVEYKDKAIIIEFTVYDIVPISGTYKGESLTLYCKEQPNFEDVFITILYTNGEERTVPLAETEIGSIDYTLDGNEKTLEVKYESVSVKIPYKVTYREIKPSNVYNYVDLVDESLSGYKITFYEDVAEVFEIVNGERKVKEKFTYQNIDNNCKLRTFRLVSKVGLVDVIYYLAGDTVYCDYATK